MSYDWENTECINSQETLTDEQKLTEKQLFVENMLKSWVEISSKEEFLNVTKILTKEGNVDISQASYENINDWLPFAIKKLNKNDAQLVVFPLQTFSWQENQWGHWIWWYISSGEAFTSDLNRDITYTKFPNNSFSESLLKYNDVHSEISTDSKQKLCVLDKEIITQVNNEPKPYVSFMSELKWKAFPFDNQESDIGELITVPYVEQAWVKVESVQQNDIIWNKDSNSWKITQEQELAVETISYTQYKVSKWDNLWKIMRNEYGLSNSTDIANILNVLSKDNNFWITDLNRKLKIGKKLNLPSEIKVKSKSRGDKVMKLKTDS
jgi:hypothetical protein